MPDFPYEVLRAGWAADSKSIWMIVNTGVRIDLFQVDLASPKPRQITKGDHALVPTSWSTVAGRHVFMIDEPTRIGDIWTWAAGDAVAGPRDGHLRLSRSRLRAAAPGARRMEGRRRHAHRRRADLSDRLQARHALSARRAAARRARGVGSVRVGLDLLQLPARAGRRAATRSCGRTIAAARATATRSIASRSAATSRTAISTCWPASIASSRWASPIPIASR